MRLLEGGPQPGVGDVGVDLRRGQRGVTEQLLDAAQVGSALQQVGGHRVPQPVRTEVGGAVDDPERAMHDPADHPLVDPVPAVAHEDRGARLREGQRAIGRRPRPPGPAPPGPRTAPSAACCPCRAPVRSGGPGRGRRDRARTARRPGCRWRTAARGSRRHGQRPVPRLGGDLQRLGQHRRRVRTLQGRGQRPNALRGPQRGGRVVLQPARLQRPATEHPHRRGSSLQRPPGPAAGLLVGQPGAQRSHGQSRQVLGTEPVQVGEQVEQVAPVGPDGVGRQVPVPDEVVDVVVQRLLQRGRAGPPPGWWSPPDHSAVAGRSACDIQDGVSSTPALAPRLRRRLHRARRQRRRRQLPAERALRQARPPRARSPPWSSSPRPGWSAIPRSRCCWRPRRRAPAGSAACAGTTTGRSPCCPPSRRPATAPATSRSPTDGAYAIVVQLPLRLLSVVAISPTGTLSEVVDSLQFVGSGPVTDRQEGPHAHQVVFDGDEMLSCDLGGDQIYRLRLDDGGVLVQPVTRSGCPPASGPRHLVVAEDHLVVACELSGELWLRRPGRRRLARGAARSPTSTRDGPRPAIRHRRRRDPDLRGEPGCRHHRGLRRRSRRPAPSPPWPSSTAAAPGRGTSRSTTGCSGSPTRGSDTITRLRGLAGCPRPAPRWSWRCPRRPVWCSCTTVTAAEQKERGRRDARPSCGPAAPCCRSPAGARR